MKRVVILTGGELRHSFFRKAFALSPEIEVAKSYCEGAEKSLRNYAESSADNEYRMRHLRAREESEKDFFAAFVNLTPDTSNPLQIPKGEINDPRCVEEILSISPDLIVSYGCSIIREPLVEAFSGRFVNVHLGLSPYYRGGGTNFWPLHNEEPEYVGATFMHIDKGIDTGNIIHQIRARIVPGDRPHDIGNRLIVDMTREFAVLARCFADLAPMPQPDEPENARLYRRKDFTEDAVKTLYERFSSAFVDRYLDEIESRQTAAPILVNPAVGLV